MARGATWRPWLVVTGTVFFAVATAAGQDAGARSIWTGVYTTEQAERGLVWYLESCAACHRDDLKGDSAEEVPALASAQFLEGWRGRTVADLVETIGRTMPGDRPGSLSPRAYVELVAFILRANGAPDGEVPLPTDVRAMAPVAIQPR